MSTRADSLLPAAPHWMNLLFAALWLLVGAGSAVDAALTVHYAPQLDEENPVARALLVREPQPGAPIAFRTDPSLLVAVKMFGTLVAFGLLAALYRRAPARAQLVAAGLALFQLLLLAYVLG